MFSFVSGNSESGTFNAFPRSKSTDFIEQLRDYIDMFPFPALRNIGLQHRLEFHRNGPRFFGFRHILLQLKQSYRITKLSTSITTTSLAELAIVSRAKLALTSNCQIRKELARICEFLLRYWQRMCHPCQHSILRPSL